MQIFQLPFLDILQEYYLKEGIMAHDFQHQIYVLDLILKIFVRYLS
jgi:hypothetical protein